MTAIFGYSSDDELIAIASSKEQATNDRIQQLKDQLNKLENISFRISKAINSMEVLPSSVSQPRILELAQNVELNIEQLLMAISSLLERIVNDNNYDFYGVSSFQLAKEALELAKKLAVLSSAEMTTEEIVAQLQSHATK
jgi:hypothetical protein